MTAYRMKLKRRFAQVGMQKLQNVSQREYPFCCVSVSDNRTAVSVQQDTEIRIAAGSVNRPAVIRFWNRLVLISLFPGPSPVGRGGWLLLFYVYCLSYSQSVLCSPLPA